ncbi:class I SAM-dependent methyltransferase [Cellulosimicrobium arenosum]|uniref:Class I SAM-dependent methyltransferase n=1 Tax=Cellulosimicrobium arenosum TaxID=2708133 RepID=A0A927G7I5_9MICO|nr:class I SAM-dependent methyltransferase [Cellulosimicrobium arenosum]MBD8078361.1 class I SAM-dependent methyltransferase [Cellulosimicrobium arenosum]
MTERRSWQSEADRLGKADPDDPTAWFERLWASAAGGDVTTPWDHDDPHPVLAAWTAAHASEDRRPAADRTAVVVGCGLGADAEHLARLGYDTTAFDVSPSAVAAARERHPDSRVRYAVGNLLDLPTGWVGAFDLVVEVYTVQAVSRDVRPAMTAGVRTLVAPAGTLLVVQLGTEQVADDGPPWPLTRAEVEAFGQDGLSPLAVDALPGPPGRPWTWRAELRRG